MKIIHFIDSGGFGGAEKYIINLVKGLKSNYKLDVSIALFKDNEYFCEVASNDQIKVYIKEQSESNNTYIKRISKDYDIVHTHGYKANILVRLALLFEKVKIVSTIHSTLDYWDNILKRIIYSKLDRLTSIRNNKIICVSNYIADYYSNILNNNRVKVVYNGIDNELFNESRSQKFDNHVIKILNIGNLEKVKNQEVLIKLVSFLIKEKNLKVELTILGEGSERGSLTDLIEQYDLEGCVFLEGFRSNVAEYLKDAHFYIHPSIDESFGLAIVEAMMASKFVIASNVGGVSEVIENKVDGILINEPSDYLQYADVILNALDNNFYFELCNNAKFNANAKFSEGNFVRNIYYEYRELII